MPAGDVPARSPRPSADNSGPDRTTADLLRGRLDPAHRRRADDPGGGDAATAARQHRPARRRDHGPARPRHDPGLDRHRHAVRPRIPGYMTAPNAKRAQPAPRGVHQGPGDAPSSYWANFPKFIVSQLKSRYGDAATAENDFGYDWHPQIVGDHSHMPMMVDMDERAWSRACSPWARTRPSAGRTPSPAAGAGQARLAGRPRPVRDGDGHLLEGLARRSKTGALKPEDIQTEVFFLPAAGVAEMDGQLHQHPAADAVAREGGRPAGRRPLGHLVHRTTSGCG